MNVVLDDKTLCDLECLMNGYFEPINTFMNEKDWRNVCENLHLSNNNFFPLPVTLALENKYNIGDIITLVDKTNYPLATLKLTELYNADVDYECKHAYGTTDTNHPYVAYKQKHRNCQYGSGKLTKINNVRHYDFIEHRMIPMETRKYFKNNGWKTIVGFPNTKPNASGTF